MPKLNLRAAFALGLASPISAQQVFANRISEIESFDSSIEALNEVLNEAEISPVVDRSAPRKNVLVYYGVGGIGKTTLSQELERRYLEEGFDSRRTRPPAVVRIDFAESSSYDLESYVLRLRAGLGRLVPRFPAFDLALSVYWSRAHPGEPLEDFINRDSVLGRARDRDLAENISSAVTDVAGLIPGTEAAYRLANLAFSRVKEAVVNHRTLKKCELLPELLEADPDSDTLSYFPYLLAWDIARLPQPTSPPVVFLDTYEVITDRATREAERWLQRSVFLMPNVLFVVTGRNRLDWAELTRPDELDFIGLERWPHLYAGHIGREPRQHLVGYLSAHDAHSYLESAVTNAGRSAIPQDIRESIVSASAGLPLYLDIAVTTYLDLLARGRTPATADFGPPLPAVAVRMLRDLTRDERDLLRAAALLNGFDLEAIRAACPHVADAAIRRFRDRPFLEVDPDRLWPYSLHQVLRDAIREADVDLSDSWSPGERAEVAARIGDHLRYVVAKANGDGDRSVEAAAFQQAVGLCALTDGFLDWLVDAAQRLVTSGSWNIGSDARLTGHDAVDALILGIRGTRERRSGRLDAALSNTEAALGQPSLPERLRQFLVLHRAHALRVAGHYSAAAVDYESLWQTTGEYSTEAGYWLADHSFLDGRFDDALSALDRLPAQSAQLRGEILRLRGHVFRVNALFSRAEAFYREALELARETGNIAAEGKALTDLVQALAWWRPEDALGVRPLAVEINEGILNKIELVKLHAAAAVAMTNSGDHAAAEAEIERGITLTNRSGYPGGLIWCWVARAFNTRKRADLDGHADAAAQVVAISADLGGNRFWGEIARWWAVTDPVPSTNPIRWLDGEDTTRGRWRAVGGDRGE
ncbi:tetratricopeptide repeat protein [Spirillospora sp. NPDC048819]|uniref:tetratricopeptide repeat protein n=1 Tax=Spirillospora sp. NPDC048819 TaxID=3155268 RepID=UPI0033F7702A